MNDEQLIWEAYNNNIIEDIINYLYNSEGYDNWKEFVDNQYNGQCQSIVSDIVHNFPMVKKVFGEIEVNDPYIDDYGDEQNLVTHHWVKIMGKYYDFSKGTLKNYISFDDIYDPSIEDAGIYHGF
jgi:hypothetical protein